MEEKILYISLALLFITSGAPVNAQTAGAGSETELVVGWGAPLTVECPLRVEARAEWRLNGSAPPGDMRPAELAAPGRLLARLSAPHARDHHQGLYTCSRDRAAHRVRVRVLPDDEAAATEAAAAADEVADEVPVAEGALLLYYDINRNLTLNCSLTSTDNTLSYVWKKNNETVDKVAELKNRHKLEQGGASLAVVGRANEEDFGQYSCALGAELLRWDVRGRPVARLPDNTNVVEGQKLKLQCRVLGRPYPRVSWLYNGSEAGANGSRLLAGGRVRLEPNEQGVPDAALVIEGAARDDAGVYECRAGPAADHTQLRVKDMYAALWPFLGICAEVFVLCAIILVYEKRRTKTEVEDSDTDNHDQKKS